MEKTFDQKKTQLLRIIEKCNDPNGLYDRLDYFGVNIGDYGISFDYGSDIEDYGKGFFDEISEELQIDIEELKEAYQSLDLCHDYVSESLDFIRIENWFGFYFTDDLKKIMRELVEEGLKKIKEKEKNREENIDFINSQVEDIKLEAEKYGFETTISEAKTTLTKYLTVYLSDNEYFTVRVSDHPAKRGIDNDFSIWEGGNPVEIDNSFGEFSSQSDDVEDVFDFMEEFNEKLIA